MLRFLLSLAVSALLLGEEPKLTPEMQTVVSHISAGSLRENLSYIASDELEGRATPSPGLDKAAAYIAAQFKAAGLEPAGDDGYFQTATLRLRTPNWDGFELSISGRDKSVSLTRDDVSISAVSGLSLNGTGILLADSSTTAESVAASVVFAPNQRIASRLRRSRALLILTTADDRSDRPTGPQVIDPESARTAVPLISVYSKPAIQLLRELLREKDARIKLHLHAPLDEPAKARNVVGILRGSDPALRDTYVMLTAHYDHLGTRPSGEDRIFNGANDDGSGTVSVIEIARAMASLDPRPARSVIFVTFFGEERGLLGSRYYGRHPIVPLDKTIADINLEQVGRTDSSKGPQVRTATLTGFDFSDVPRIIAQTGHFAGVMVYKDEESSDPFFDRSDNQALADVGIPAHTLCVAFDYPDYHQVGDESNKIDYDNMAKVDDAVGIALLRLASDAPPPKWNESNPGAKRYAEAAKRLHER